MLTLKLPKSRLPSPRSFAAGRGDTIIEVLISMTILSLVLVITFVSTSRSLRQGNAAASRQTATSYAQQQVELIKANPSLYKTPGAVFCILPGSPTPVTDLSQCNFNGQYSITDTFNKDLFTISANWQGATSQDNLALYYKIPSAGAYKP